MAMMFPTPTCELFLPGHHVHFIQWKKALETRSPRSVRLISREGTTVVVRVGRSLETWRFHDEEHEREALDRWEEAGAPATLLDYNLLRVPSGLYLYPCRKPEDWQDCRTAASLQFESEDPSARIAQQVNELGGYLGPGPGLQPRGGKLSRPGD